MGVGRGRDRAKERSGELHATAERRLAGPKAAGGLFVDDKLGRTRAVGEIGEIGAGHERDAHRRKITGRNLIKQGAVGPARLAGAAFEFEGGGREAADGDGTTAATAADSTPDRARKPGSRDSRHDDPT